MPWWSWVLIWSGLALVLLSVLVLFSVVLFRKLMTLGQALGELGDRVSIGSAHPGEAPATARSVPAIFQTRDRLAEVVADRRFDRLLRRQLRRDRAIRRGKLFGTLPALSKDSPHAQ
ncbi:hypothetical protein D6T64_07535 [Cryobacterium melibiosiphilum]|uniref:Uncharacterized protein n=1 Tax=Cryobacterium melibiosiphilum TaxID=995039 RepID=A0A3A5MJQ1_9MICO|nr:hypothetical protein [Cryobacterium melibiosiphilum]RJT89255.1 hypothetical protein D6T64_07535 [Cryobacterium melibiosiphilum]